MEPVTPTTKLIVRSKRPEIAAGVNSPYILMQFAGGPGGPIRSGPRYGTTRAAILNMM